MKLIIVHHHLKPGGVTRIIQSQTRALSHYPDIETVILAGGPKADSANFPDAQITYAPELDYLTDQAEKWKLQLDNIRKQLRQNLDPESIIHVHNANLGKNPLLSLAISEIAEQGFPILLHCHDFAEDRPENMAFIKRVLSSVTKRPPRQVIYPEAPNCLYAVINNSDRERLLNAGIRENRLLLLPNPVELPENKEPRENAAQKLRDTLKISPEKKIISYPVRPIRRKNLGEFILLAAKFAAQAEFVVTLNPKNPTEITQYNKWKQLAEELNLPIHFEAGAKIPFPTIMRGSDFCLTTSIREGFGMVFLEPWLFQTPVVGRNLPMVVDDFKQNKIRFPFLYDQLRISRHRKIADFPEFELSEQITIVRDFVRRDRRENVLKIEFPDSIFSPVPQPVIQNNINNIKKSYSLTAYGEQLYASYKQLATGA